MQKEILDTKVLVDDGSFKNCWKENVPIEEYHSDRSFVSSSMLKKILIKSAKTFHFEQFQGKEKEPSDAMRMGKLAHLAILEGDEFEKRYVIMPKFEAPTLKGEMSEQSKEAKIMRRDWIAAQHPDSIIVTAEQKYNLVGMVKAIVENETAKEFLREGLPEISGYYVDPETKIRLRIRPDFMSFERDIISDLKKTKNCHERSFQYDIWSDGGAFDPYWYDFQLAMYCEGYFHITGRKIKAASWLAIEDYEPWETAVHPMTGAVQALGLVKYRTALRTLRECIDKGEWPGVQAKGQVSYILPPEHILNKYEINFEGDLI